MLIFLRSGSLWARIMVLVAIAALGIGFVGTLQYSFKDVDVRTESYEYLIKLVLDSVGLTYRVFLPKVADNPGTSSWLLTIANVLGSSVTFAAVISICLTVFKQQINRLWMVFLHGHSLVFGFDNIARSFAHSLPNKWGSRLVVINSDCEHDLTQQCQSAKYFHVFQQLEDMNKKAKSYALKRARRIIISTGKDEENLTLLERISQVVPKNTIFPLEIVVNVENARLLEYIESNDAILALEKKFGKVIFFNAARQGAIDLIYRTPFVDLALHRKQKRVRLVVLGTSDIAIESVLQFLRVSPTIGLLRPQIDWFIEDPDEFIGKLHNRNEVLGRMVAGASGAKAKDVPLHWAINFNIHQLSTGSTIPQLDMLTKLDKGDEITAVLVAEGGEIDNAATALALRQITRRLGIWNAPIYVWSREKTALDAYFCRFNGVVARKGPQYLAALSSSDEPGEIMEPFGRTELLCNIDTIKDERGNLAKQIHDAYLEKRREEAIKEPSARDESMLAWDELSETYRRANRRAADHYLIKLISAGLLISDPARPPKLSMDKLQHGNLLEKLSGIEHDAWRIDRELDGWRWCDTRDNQKKLHPDLIAYSKLSEAIKDYDRDQIRFLAGINWFWR